MVIVDNILVVVNGKYIATCLHLLCWVFLFSLKHNTLITCSLRVDGFPSTGDTCISTCHTNLVRTVGNISY